MHFHYSNLASVIVTDNDRRFCRDMFCWLEIFDIKTGSLDNAIQELAIIVFYKYVKRTRIFFFLDSFLFLFHFSFLYFGGVFQ